MLYQQFKAEKPNEKAVGDITYQKTKLGVYLAAVIDLYNREVIEYEVSRRLGSELACFTLGNVTAKKRKTEICDISQ